MITLDQVKKDILELIQKYPARTSPRCKYFGENGELCIVGEFLKKRNLEIPNFPTPIARHIEEKYQGHFTDQAAKFLAKIQSHDDWGYGETWGDLLVDYEDLSWDEFIGGEKMNVIQ